MWLTVPTSENENRFWERFLRLSFLFFVVRELFQHQYGKVIKKLSLGSKEPIFDITSFRGSIR